VTVLLTIGVYVTHAVNQKEKIKRNPESAIGKNLDTKRKPHVTYVVSKRYTPLKLPCFILTVI